jgi:hypothetical protein
MAKSTESAQPKSGAASFKMHKRVETKEDGRLLIYYTFGSSAPAEKPAAAAADKAVKK